MPSNDKASEQEMDAAAAGALYDKLVKQGKVAKHQPQHRGDKGGKHAKGKGK